MGLIDVFGLSTGAMISAGFLLPGLASAHRIINLSFLFSGSILIILPCSALPNFPQPFPVQGAYFCWTEALAMGTVGGVGTYLALTLKTAFALLNGVPTLRPFSICPSKRWPLFSLLFLWLSILGAKKHRDCNYFSCYSGCLSNPVPG